MGNRQFITGLVGTIEFCGVSHPGMYRPVERNMHHCSLHPVGIQPAISPRLKAFHIPARHSIPDEMNMHGNYVLAGQYNLYPDFFRKISRRYILPCDAFPTEYCFGIIRPGVIPAYICVV
jgi:hypothetical protein